MYKIDNNWVNTCEPGFIVDEIKMELAFWGRQEKRRWIFSWDYPVSLPD
ncbi:MAG: hypothetical protein P9M03_02805 [Candidatus Theseobacter exili]|nr:hypothetical protein [Candidatus Theseobacter exili]